MRIRHFAAGVTVAVVVLAAHSAGASADTINFDVPVSGPVFNSCTGETVIIEGTQHMKVTDNSSVDALKSQIESNLTGVKGTTLTGVRYVMNDQTSDMEHADFDPFGNAQLTMENSTILNRQGETGALITGDDFRLHVLTHLTVTNGVPRAQRSDLRADCR
jgi:hypothetical protein